MQDPIIIGSFGKTYGVHGWIKINSFTTPKENILKFKPWLIQRKDSWEDMHFEDSRERPDSIIVKLPNYDSPEAARSLTNVKIGIQKSQLPKLGLEEYYWTDLVGLKVTNLQGIDLGIVEQMMATGANDVLILTGDRKRLIPYISNVIQQVDLDKKNIQVDWEKDY